MELDFHYYATYLAGCLAGFPADAATRIAHAAQYIDESDPDMLTDSSGGFLIRDFKPVPTVHTNAQLAKMVTDNPTSWTASSLRELRQVWSVFHFLPGNYGTTPGATPYMGPLAQNSWTFGADEASAFQMMCLPNSRLAFGMINDTILNHRGKDYVFELIGARLHTLADTRAHMYYSGTPVWCVNDVAENVWDLSTGGRDLVKWRLGWPPGISDDSEWATPNSPFFASTFYLGHGRMGHVPDYPWMKYEYTPRWSAGPIVKDNPQQYIEGFKQMVAALRCLNEDRLFDENSPSGISADTEANVRLILTDCVTDHAHRNQLPFRIAAWKEALMKMSFDGKVFGAPPDFDPMKWKNEAQTSGDIRGTCYWRFNYGARIQRDYVAAQLKEDIGVEIDPDIGHARLSVLLLNYDQAYYGPVERSNSTNYPTVNNGQNAPLLKLILPQGHTGLRHGDIVKIITPEPEAGTNDTLAAWRTKALYYSVNDYDDITNQRWRVEKTTPDDKPVRPGEFIYLRNNHYNQFMVWYNDGNKRYLTTRADRAPEGAWIVNTIGGSEAAPVLLDFSWVTLTAAKKLSVHRAVSIDGKLYPQLTDVPAPLSLHPPYRPPPVAPHPPDDSEPDQMADGVPLKNGDIVQIRATESTAKPNDTLTASASDHRLYYYSTNDHPATQEWRVTKMGGSDGDVIRAGDRISLANKAFPDAPYATCGRENGRTFMGRSTVAFEWVIGVTW